MNNLSKQQEFSFAKVKTAKYCRKTDFANPNNRRSFSNNIQEKIIKVRKSNLSIFNILERILIKKMRIAYNKLFFGLKKSQKRFQVKFLPGSSHAGDLYQNPSLLELLKNQRYSSQFSLKIKEAQFSSRKIYKLTNVINRVCQERKVKGFQMLIQHLYQTNALVIKQMSSELKVETQASQKYLHNFQCMPISYNQRKVEISYVKIKLNKNKINREDKAGLSTKIPQKIQDISLKELQKISQKKYYTFDSLDNKLIRKRQVPIILQ